MVLSPIEVLLATLLALATISSDVIAANSTSAVNVTCSPAPPNVNISRCCETPIPFAVEVLLKCQDVQAQWIALGNGTKTEMQCGSECIINEMKDMSKFFTNLAQSPSPKWLEWLTQLLASNSVCMLKINNFKEVLRAAVGNSPNICDVDLVAIADCISRNMFLTCSSRSDSRECASVVTFLSGPCMFSDLNQDQL
ncbi:uncharacterized protein LOC129720540 [Wyeomyia smithii]|uniref:uncharacterized protein LOC129720540 n=1 Tax=Wyeomyia smithii TaxID=174621 RepID=UPI002467F2B6|nr:uncharacterized protein LOC129720540 [Wyeomyia smithii]